MFGTIRRHQTWLWVVIITLTVIAFVVYFSPYQRVSPGLGGEGSLGTIAGKPVTLPDYRAAEAEVYLNYFLARGRWPDRDPEAKQMNFDLQREVYFRLMLIAKQREAGIHVAQEAVNRLAAEILSSSTRGGIRTSEEFARVMNDFEKRVLNERGLTRVDFERFLRHELGTQQLATTLGVTGRLITPQEAEALFRREHEQMQVEAVFLHASNFLAQVTVTPEGVSDFYTNYRAAYRLPDRVQVRYVKFELTNFLAQADEQMATITNLNEQLEAEYLRRGTNAFPAGTSPEEARAQLKDEMRRGIALTKARNEAAKLLDELLNLDPLRAENLEALAAKRQLEVRDSSVFDRETGPAGLNVPATFINDAFKLSELTPIVERPIVAEDGVYVVVLKAKYPSEFQELEAIRDRVTADYRFLQAVQLARAAGSNLVAKLAEARAAGQPFSNVMAAAGFSVVPLPAFSLATRFLPEADQHGVNLGLLQEVAYRTPPGQTSELIATRDGGFVLHSLGRSPVSEEQVQKELPGFLSFLRQTRANEAFNDWFRRQASELLRDTPLARALMPGTPGAAP